MNEPNQTPAANWLRGLPRAVIAAFVCCFLAGYIAHLFAFTNIIPNSDGISRVSDAQQMTISGRWFLHYATAWNNWIQAPAVIGFFSVLFLSLSAALTASLLRVRSAFLGGLIGALMAVFPSVAYTFLYMFTASAYCFGILLAVLAVWLNTRYRLGFLGGIVLLACAVGTYQAYLAVAVSLALLWLILYGLEGTHSAKEVLLTALKQLAFLLLGLGLYFVILWIFLRVKDLTLLNYKGISTLGEDLSLGGILTLTASAYKNFFSYFFIPGDFSSYTTPLAVAAHAVLFLAALWAFVRIARGNRCGKRPGALILTLVLCALLPLALNLTVLMGEAMPIMRFALVFAYVLALVLMDGAADETRKTAGKRKNEGRRVRIAKGLAAGAAAAMLAVSFNVDNLAYTVSAQAHRATESFASRLVERVESTPGYQNGMEVVVIGGFPSQIYYSQIQAYALVTNYSNLSSSVIPLNKHVYYYLNDWLNVPWREPAEETMKAVAASAVFKAMPLYPDDGSVVIDRGRVIVKLASGYTPKRDYEIAYENRR